MDNVYSLATNVFKTVREKGWLHEDISRKKAMRAIVRVLTIKSEGDYSPSIYLDIPLVYPVLTEKGKYNKAYLNRAIGLMRYLRGDYIGRSK